MTGPSAAAYARASRRAAHAWRSRWCALDLELTGLDPRTTRSSRSARSRSRTAGSASAVGLRAGPADPRAERGVDPRSTASAPPISRRRRPLADAIGPLLRVIAGRVLGRRTPLRSSGVPRPRAARAGRAPARADRGHRAARTSVAARTRREAVAAPAADGARGRARAAGRAAARCTRRRADDGAGVHRAGDAPRCDPPRDGRYDHERSAADRDDAIARVSTLAGYWISAIRPAIGRRFWAARSELAPDPPSFATEHAIGGQSARRRGARPRR